MFLFVFQNDLHRKNYRYSTSTQLAENRGQFDRRLLNKSLKEYTIVGYGQHALHQIVKDNHAEGKLLAGHFLMVETRKQAMWVKLNYDVVAKKDLKLIETYEGLSAEFIRDSFKEYHSLYRQAQMASARWNSAHLHNRRLAESAKYITTNTTFSEETRAHIKSTCEMVSAETNSFHQEAERLRSARDQAFANALATVKNCQLGSAPIAIQ